MAINDEADILERILSEEEKEALKVFFENPHMVEAVRKSLTSKIYNQGTLSKEKDADPTINFLVQRYWDAKRQGFDKEQIGDALSNACEGLFALEEAWKSLENFKGVTIPEVTEKNPAR